MPMNYEAPLEAIRTAIALALGIPDRIVMGRAVHQVEWEHRKSAARVTKDVWADLSLNGWGSIGRDFLVHDTVVVDGEELVVDRISGNRTFHVTCIVRSNSQEPGLSAQVRAERLRTRLRLPRVRAVYRAAGVGFSHVGFSGTHDWVDADERWLSEAVVDITWLLAVNEVDDLDTAGGYVGEVEATGTFESGHDGAPIEVLIDTDPASNPEEP